MSKIKRARLAAGLSQSEIGSAIGRSGMYVCLAERGQVPVSADVEHVMLVAIARLAALKESIRRSKELLMDDMQLPCVGSSIR